MLTVKSDRNVEVMCFAVFCSFVKYFQFHFFLQRLIYSYHNDNVNKMVTDVPE